MKITNKFDMLDAMSDISEEYIRKADRLLAQHHTGEAAVKMEITPMKFSWRSVAAVAACLVILVGMTFGIKAFMNKPVDVLTPAQQAYLNEWKDKLGGSVNVAYAVDRLNFIELEIPDDVTPLKFIDENRAVFIRDEKRGDEYVKTIEIYNFADKSYSVIAGGSGKINLIKQLDICYADNDYVIHQGESYQVTGVFIPSAQLSLYNVKTGEDTVIYTSEYGGINWQIPMTVLDGKVYFTVYDQLDERSIHVYDIQQQKEIDVIANAGSPQKYKGDILYITEENGRTVTRSISGKYSYDGGVWATEYGLYQYNYTGEERLKDLESGKVIIPGDTKGIVNLDDSCDFALQFGGFTINSTAAAENALGFLFYAPTNEALVFQNGDGFSGFSCFGWGATVSKKEPDGTARTFLVTNKESKNAVKIPKLEPDPYLEEMKYIFGARGSVDYARNKLDITEYDISGFESVPLLVDKNRAVITGKDNSGYPEIRLHDLGSGKQTALYSCKDDPEIDQNTDIDVLYADKDYAVFDIKFYAGATLKKRELRVTKINGSGSYTAYTMEGDAVSERMVIVDDTLYFNTYVGEKKHNMINRYRIGAEEKAEIVVEGYRLGTYNGKVYYYTSGNETGLPEDPLAYTIYINFHVLDGEMPFDAKKYIGFFMVGETGIFHNDGQMIADCVNDEALLSFNTSGYLFANLYDSMMMITVEENITHQNRKVIYNTKTNELLVFANGDDLYYVFQDYREFDGGMYYMLKDGDAYSKLCVITEKAAKPVETDEKQYIDQMKEFFGSNGSVDYARNKLDIKEYDLSGLDSVPVFIDKDRYIVSELAGDGLPILKMYDTKRGTDTVIYDRKIDPNIDDETKITLFYADTKYAVFVIYFYAGATLDKHWLRVLDHTTGTCYTVCEPYARISNKMAISNNSLYFMKGAIDYNVVCRYVIGSDGGPEEIGVGDDLAVYNQDLYFAKTDHIIDELGQSSSTLFLRDSETRYCTGEPGCDIAFGKYGIFGSKPGGVVYDYQKSENILSGGETDKLRLELYDFALWIGDDNNNKAVYNLKTDELLVFEEGDDFYENAFFSAFDGGMYAYTLDDESLIDKVYVITEKGSQTETKPEPEPPKTERNYTSNVPEAELSDLMSITSEDFPLPEKINGYSYQDNGFADRSKLNVLLMNNNNEYIEYGIYDIETGDYLMLFDQRDNPQRSALLGKCGQYVYCVGKNSLWVAADIGSDPEISKCKVFEIGKEVYPLDKFTYRNSNVSLGSDGKLYFNGFDEEPVYDENGYPDISYTRSVLYRFDSETGVTEKILDGAFSPHEFGDDILYETKEYSESGGYPDDMLKSLSGKISLDYGDFYRPSSNYRSGIIVCGDKIFGLKTVVQNDPNKDKQLINVLTGEVILQTAEITAYKVTDNIIQIDTYEKDTRLLYFINENRLVTVRKGDAAYDGMINETYDGFGVIRWHTGLTRDGKLYTYSMK